MLFCLWRFYLYVLLNSLHFTTVVLPGKPSWRLIVRYFGREILVAGSEQLDRAKLGKIVFENEEKRSKLNSFTHPYIQRAMLWQVVKFFLKGEPESSMSPCLHLNSTIANYRSTPIVEPTVSFFLWTIFIS